MTKIHNISNVKFDSNFLILVVDGKTLKLKLDKLSMKLANANETERNNFIISASGYGIHWPTIDEDISINGILENTQNRHSA
jgi:hypothetical protein